MLRRELSIQMARGRDEDEKELLFFISDECENEREEDNRIVDPCHQNLLTLLDRLLLTTAIFIAIAVWEISHGLQITGHTNFSFKCLNFCKLTKNKTSSIVNIANTTKIHPTDSRSAVH